MSGGRSTLWRTSLCGVVMALTVFSTGCAVDASSDAEDDTEEVLHLLHHLDERGVEVAQERGRHRAQDARVNWRGAGPEQEPLGRVELADRHDRRLYTSRARRYKPARCLRRDSRRGCARWSATTA